MDTGSKRPGGDITTLLDLASRDRQDNDLFPLDTDTTWFSRPQDRRQHPFTPVVQEIPFRGPAAFGQHFIFDIGALTTGDLLFGAVLQVQLDHWLDLTTQLNLAAGTERYLDPSGAYTYANSLGTSLIADAELEIDGKTVEMFDGDWANTWSLLYPDLNQQFGTSAYNLGRVPSLDLFTSGQARARLFPTEDGIIHCLLPFYFMRTRYREALPMLAAREGSVRLHITLRPFDECVRRVQGSRPTCTSTPLNTSFAIIPTAGGTARQVQTSVAPPPLKSVTLVTIGALLDGPLRQRILREPFEHLHREVQTFEFTEPLKYAAQGRSQSDTIVVQLPLEANHPVEEIVWFIRRKGVANNNEWANYTAALERDWADYGSAAALLAAQPLLVSAKVQVNGLDLIAAEEQYFRAAAAQKHRGGIAAWRNMIYSYTVARRPGEFQPSGTMNASRANSLRLTLEVRPPGGALDQAWEVKVFCVALNWMRFENGLANAIFED